MGQNKKTLSATVDEGIIASMDRIIAVSKYYKKDVDDRAKKAYYKYDESFYKTIETDAVYLAGQYGITSQQAVLFTFIIDYRNGDRVDLADFLEKHIKTDVKKRLHRPKLGKIENTLVEFDFE